MDSSRFPLVHESQTVFLDLLVMVQAQPLQSEKVRWPRPGVAMSFLFQLCPRHHIHSSEQSRPGLKVLEDILTMGF
jgi:hypothetical protein